MIFSCVLFYSINFQQICEREKDIEKKKRENEITFGRIPCETTNKYFA